MKCHYEVLGVPRDADDTEIKRSYRKLALTYHPDKNPDKIDEVMELFREVQSAYDVLSDPQERAWYDKHREAIIRGGDDYVDDSLDVMYYFNSSVYTGFDDGAKSFYTVFRDAFSRLAKEDELFLDDDCEGYVVPDFGYATSDYESVVMPFYNYWLAYHTKKSFVWKEKYDIRQAPNRPTQRLMEKENKKLRETHRKKRNEEVRALVSFVRKRDKRVQEEQKKMKLKREEQEKKVREKREQDKIIRNKMLEDYTEAEWMTFDESKLDDIDSHFDDQFGSVVRNNSDESDDDEPHYYCIACDKNFKSEKALANHEKSKKHKENVELIKNELADDFFEEDLHSNNAFRNNELFDDLDTDSNFTRLSSMNLPRNIVKRNVTEKVGHASVCNQSGEVASHGDFIVNSMKDKCKLEENGQASDENISDHGFGECFQNGRGSNEEVTIIEAEKNNVTRGSISNENFHACNGEGELSTAIEKDDQNKLCNMEESKKEKSKKDKKKKEKQGENTSIYSCEVCSKIFPTRNKLFNHIKEEGHAVLKEQKKRTKKSKGKKK